MNALIVYEFGHEHVETRLYFVKVDGEELKKLKLCHGKYLEGAGNKPEDVDALKWLDEELEKGKFKDCRIKHNAVATLEKEDVPVVVIVSGHAL